MCILCKCNFYYLLLFSDLEMSLNRFMHDENVFKKPPDFKVLRDIRVL